MWNQILNKIARKNINKNKTRISYLIFKSNLDNLDNLDNLEQFKENLLKYRYLSKLSKLSRLDLNIK